MKRIPHGQERHEDESRPTSEAVEDRTKAVEIYLDVETGYYVFVGGRGRTHVFTIEGLHHTSFRTTQKNRIERLASGKWERLIRAELPEDLK